MLADILREPVQTYLLRLSRAFPIPSGSKSPIAQSCCSGDRVWQRNLCKHWAQVENFGLLERRNYCVVLGPFEDPDCYSVMIAVIAPFSRAKDLVGALTMG